MQELDESAPLFVRNPAKWAGILGGASGLMITVSFFCLSTLSWFAAAAFSVALGVAFGLFHWFIVWVFIRSGWNKMAARAGDACGLLAGFVAVPFAGLLVLYGLMLVVMAVCAATAAVANGGPPFAR